MSRALVTLAFFLSFAGHAPFAQGATRAAVEAGEALVAAVRTGDAPAAARALADGADPDGTAGLPPLLMAATRGDVDVARLLLDEGADPEFTGSAERSALVVALTGKNHDIARLLIEAGADVNRREIAPGRSPLQLVIDEAPSLESMELLLTAGADIDQADFRGETALASAAFMNRPDATRLLIERGARPDVVNGDGVSPLEWARRQGNDEIAAALEAAGAS